jgi:hypothetical protein
MSGGSSGRGPRLRKRHLRSALFERLLQALSEPYKVWDSNKRQSQYDEQNGVGNKIRENHQGDAAGQRHDHLLAFAIDKKSEPN